MKFKKFYIVLLLLMAILVPISFSAESVVPNNRYVGNVNTIIGGYDYLTITAGSTSSITVFGGPNQYLTYDGDVTSIDSGYKDFTQGSLNSGFDNVTVFNDGMKIVIEREIEDFEGLTYYFENVAVLDDIRSPYYSFSFEDNAIIDCLITFDADIYYRVNNNGSISLEIETIHFTADYSTFNTNGNIHLLDLLRDGSQYDDGSEMYSSIINGYYYILNASLSFEAIFQGVPYQNYLTHIQECGYFHEWDENAWGMLLDYSSFDVDVSNFGTSLLESLNNFLSFELVPGFSLFILLGLLLAVPLLIYILKMFLGG